MADQDKARQEIGTAEEEKIKKLLKALFSDDVSYVSEGIHLSIDVLGGNPQAHSASLDAKFEEIFNNNIVFNENCDNNHINSKYNEIYNQEFSRINITPENNKALILKIMADANIEKTTPDYCYRGIGLGVEKSEGGYKVNNVYNKELESLKNCVLTHYYDHKEQQYKKLSELEDTELAELFHKNDENITIKYIDNKKEEKVITITKKLFKKEGVFNEMDKLSIEAINKVVIEAKDQIKEKVKSLVSEVDGLQVKYIEKASSTQEKSPNPGVVVESQRSVEDLKKIFEYGKDPGW